MQGIHPDTLNNGTRPMFIEAISTIHIQAAPEHASDLGLRLENIVIEIGTLPDCLGYLVARCTIAPDLWVVSSHWTTLTAMERHFTDPALKPFIDLLASRAVRRIEFNSFFNKHASKLLPFNRQEAS